jgi:transketolase
MSHGFEAPALSQQQLDAIADKRRHAAADIIRLTSLAGSGHPGGSLSSLDALLVLYTCMNHKPSDPEWDARDRVVVSHGHISPGVYATLGGFGYFDMNQAYVGFRRCGSAFGGHIETVVPGVEWNTGNLGQGLSVGAGFAMAARMRGLSSRAFVLMGDGEQQKGQIGEARRFAAKFRLNHLVAMIDVNGLQIGGRTSDIMPFDLAGDWAADGWNVLTVDGHDHQALYGALRSVFTGAVSNPQAPTVLLMQTVMGKGIPEIENKEKYHGQCLSSAQAQAAFELLGVDGRMDELTQLRRSSQVDKAHHVPGDRNIRVHLGEPRTYEATVSIDCRSAYGSALADLARLNRDAADSWPIVGISCDLEGSVKMNEFHAVTPDRFLEVGIAEHHAAVLTGALSREKIIPFYSTFGMFAVVEGYNQQRLNDQNVAAPKVVVTHCGLDVGEDGPTHQCVDYVALMRNLFGWECFVPADPNETDRIVRAVAGRYAPTLVAMGRSKLPVIADADGNPLLGGSHRFEPGQWVTVRPGSDATVFAVGPMVYRAVQASDELARDGFGLRVVNASSLKPFDRACIIECARTTGALLTYEDHHADTGLGAIVNQVLVEERIAAAVRRLGVSRYSTSGVPDDLFAAQGLSPAHLVQAARELVAGVRG